MNIDTLVLTIDSSKAASRAFELNEQWMTKLQDCNQQLVDILSRLDSSIQLVEEQRSLLDLIVVDKCMTIEEQDERIQQLVDKFTGMDSSIQFIEERRDLLDLIVFEKCMTIDEQNEQSAIMADPKHRDFYLLVQQKLKCMIKSCETLSTGMVQVGGGDLRAFCARTIRAEGYNIFKETKVGFFIGRAVEWSKRNLAFIPFVDSIGSIFQAIVSLVDEHDRYMGLALVADFATKACLLRYGSSSLNALIEKVARYFVRARIELPCCEFLEEVDAFGKLKQLMIKLLADCGNTPAKEQASKAAECVFAHIMKPDEKSILFGVLNNFIHDVGLAEALAATALDISVQDLNHLKPISMSPPAGIIPTSDTPTVNSLTANSSNALLNGKYAEINAPFLSATYASSDVVAEQVAKLQKQEEMIQKLDAMIQNQNEMIRQLNRKIASLEKSVENDSGGGTAYAKPEEVFKNEIASIKQLKKDIRGLGDEVTTIDNQVSTNNLRTLMIEERFKEVESEKDRKDVHGRPLRSKRRIWLRKQ